MSDLLPMITLPLEIDKTGVSLRFAEQLARQLNLTGNNTVLTINGHQVLLVPTQPKVKSAQVNLSQEEQAFIRSVISSDKIAI